MTPLPPYCHDCPHPAHAALYGREYRWYCRLHSSAQGIPCDDLPTLRERCHRVRAWEMRGCAA